MRRGADRGGLRGVHVFDISDLSANVYDIGENEIPGGSLDDPEFLFHITEPGVGTREPGIGSGNWHSAAWTWEGEVIILCWEPGGGSGPRCSRNGLVVGETDDIPVIQQDVHKSSFFYDADDGSKLGQFVLPREQTLEENCTIHNYNVVPLKNQNRPRYVLVAGNYQSGISVVDFSNPASAKEIAFLSPLPMSLDREVEKGRDFPSQPVMGEAAGAPCGARGPAISVVPADLPAGERRCPV